MRRLLLLVSAVMLVDTMFYAALAPLLPHYTDELGLTKTDAGVLTAAFGVGTLAGALPAGLLAARIGVKPVLLLGLGVLGGTSLVFGLASTAWVLEGARFLQGAGGACTWTASLAWLVAVAPRERRGEVIGAALGAAIGGALLGPVLGGAAATIGPEPAFASVAVLVTVLAFFVRAMPPVDRAESETKGQLLTALQQPRIVAGMWLVALPAMLFGTLSVLAPLRLDGLGFGVVAIGAVFLVSAAVEAALSPVIGRLFDRHGLVVAPAALVAATAVSLLLPLPDTRWTLAALVVAAGIAYGGFWVPAMALLSRGAEASGLEQSIAFGLMNLAWAAGQGLGSFTAGALGERVGDAVPYLGGAGLCAVTLAVFGLTRPAAAAYSEGT